MLVTVLYGLLSLILFAAIFAVTYRLYRQGAHAASTAIRAPRGIQEGRFVQIGGIEQWISLRGEDIGNPVLLLVHGGPGSAMSALTYQRLRPFEAHFTVAQWDQRGAGRTFGRHGKAGAGEMTIDRMVQDGIEVVEHLLRDLGRDKLILLGLSWGSLLGTEMVRRRPELFLAYVGAGQVVDMQQGEAVSYAALMAQLQARADAKSIAALEAVGPPPYASRMGLMAQRRILFQAGSAVDRATMRAMPMALLTSPGLSAMDTWAYVAGAMFSIAALYDALMAYRIGDLGTRFEVPMIYIQGADDIQTPTALVEEYVQEVDAPRKALVLLDEGAAHMAIVTHVEAFLAALVEQVGA